MSEQETEVQLPLAIRQVIQLHDAKIREYQQVALAEIQQASVEIMGMLKLNPEDGWRLDIENLKFVKVSPEQTTDGTA